MPGEAKNKDEPDYKEKCRTLKRKLRFLVHEQECFQEELRKAQRKLLKVSRDKNFLLDRLLQYEKVIFSGSDSEPTDSSEDEKEQKKQVQVNEPKQIVPPEKPKVKRKPKKKPAKKLQAEPKLGPGKTVLPIQLQSPPSTLKQHMPQLVEMLNRAAATSVGPVSPDTFAGLPYAPAYALPHLPNPSNLAQVYEQLPPPSTTTSVLPSLLMSHQFPRLGGMMRNLPGPLDPPPRKKNRKESGKSSAQSNHSKLPKPEAQPPPLNISQPPEEPAQSNGSMKDSTPSK